MRSGKQVGWVGVGALDGGDDRGCVWRERSEDDGGGVKGMPPLAPLSLFLNSFVPLSRRRAKSD